MNSTAGLDGSDAQDRRTSTLEQRYSAFKEHLGHAVLILESLDSSLLDHLKQDEACKDLVNKLLLAFPTVPLSSFAGQIDQAVKSGLEGIVANIARIRLLAESRQETDPLAQVRKTVQPTTDAISPSAGASALANTPASAKRSSTDGPVQVRPSTKDKPRLPGCSAWAAKPPVAVIAQKRDEEVLKREVTIHFLKGGYTWSTPKIIKSIEKLVSDAEDREYTVLHSNRFSAAYQSFLCLTSFPATDSFPSMIKSIPFAPLWNAGTIARIRDGGTVEYGFKIIVEATGALFDLDPGLAHNRHQIDDDYLFSSQDRLEDDIAVLETVAAGIYMLSGNIICLQQLFADGDRSMEMVIHRTNPDGARRTDIYKTVIRPFRLQY